MSRDFRPGFFARLVPALQVRPEIVFRFVQLRETRLQNEDEEKSKGNQHRKEQGQKKKLQDRARRARARDEGFNHCVEVVLKRHRGACPVLRYGAGPELRFVGPFWIPDHAPSSAGRRRSARNL